jgi:hypothetical protein
MNEDIIEWARKAGFVIDGNSWIHAGAVLIDGRKSIDKHLARFAALVRADERAACAKLMDDMAAQDNLTNYYKVAARAIRERSQE